MSSERDEFFVVISLHRKLKKNIFIENIVASTYLKLELASFFFVMSLTLVVSLIQS